MYKQVYTMTSTPEEAVKQYLVNQGFQVTVDEEERIAKVRCPGLTIDSYYMYTHNPKLSPTMELLDQASYFSRNVQNEDGKTFQEFDEMMAGRAYFVVCTKLAFLRPWYDFNVPKHFIDCLISVGHIGTSSYVEVRELKSLTGINLAKEECKLIRINKDIRRPDPLPDWWKKKYAKYSAGCDSIKLQRLSKPDQTSCNQVQVFWRDIDPNNHLNYKYFIEYVLNTAHLMGTRGKLLNILDNMKNGLKEVNMQFFNEAVEGDILDVYVWEDSAHKTKLYGEVCNGTNVLFQSEATYFTQTNGSSKL